VIRAEEIRAIFFEAFLSRIVEFSQEDEISAARDNVGSAAQVAAGLGKPPGDALREAANIAFMDAIGIALLAAAASSFAGALLLLRFMPARDLPSAS